MTNYSFKPGDRVRRKNNSWRKLQRGKIYTVKSCNEYELITREYPDHLEANPKNFELVERGEDMSSVKVQYKEEKRPIEVITWLGNSRVAKNNIHVHFEGMTDINGWRNPDDVIEFAEALIELANQVKDSSRS